VTRLGHIWLVDPDPILKDVSVIFLIQVSVVVRLAVTNGRCFNRSTERRLCNISYSSTTICGGSCYCDKRALVQPVEHGWV